jgi:ABC-type antimicrobial peptide transport system permease subunit
MIWTKLVFGGFGRRGFEALVAATVLAVAVAVLVESSMVIEGAWGVLSRAERHDRPDIVQVKSRFNRALFETPHSGNLPPLTLPVYEPLIDVEQLTSVVDRVRVVARQSLFRNVVSANDFLNVYVFGIDPTHEAQVSRFSVGRGRFLRDDDHDVAVVDQASASALGVDVGGAFPIRKADGEDLRLVIVGILDKVELRDPPPRTVETPELRQGSNYVSSGVFVPLSTSTAIFGRSTLTDALVVARSSVDVPSLADELREAFRLEPGVFITERYGQYRRKVHDFAVTTALFTTVGTGIALLTVAFVTNLLHDLYADRRTQLATLVALGFSSALSILPDLGIGLATGLSGAITGGVAAIAFGPKQFAMPSLMAELGVIDPKFGLLAFATVSVTTVAAVTLGMVPTLWRIHRASLAATLSGGGQ